MRKRSIRVFGFVATEADVCVLIARRSKHLNMMVRWDLTSDKFDAGQWLARQIEFDRSDLSPDGRILGYYALNDGRRPTDGPHPGHYIVLCRPPYFTALALWWTGGKQADRVLWNGSYEVSVGKGAGHPPDKGEVQEPFRVGEAKDIWRYTSVWPYDESRLERKGLKIKGDPSMKRFFESRDSFVDWTDVDHRGRLLFAREGRVFVRDSDGERELFDLNPYEFQVSPPPEWAKQWPEG